MRQYILEHRRQFNLYSASAIRHPFFLATMHDAAHTSAEAFVS